ncbi:MAG: beta-galactosidase, partial [Alistipes sp.]|nr:beta-galactosidase [Alistipes sp.]
MKQLILTACALVATLSLSAQTVRTEQLLKEWEFRRDHAVEATEGWQTVRIPHDWAIYGPFSREHDLQRVAVVQNGETVATEKTGRTGGLPYMGKGCYRTNVTLQKADDARYILLFDGAMS